MTMIEEELLRLLHASLQSLSCFLGFLVEPVTVTAVKTAVENL